MIDSFTGQYSFLSNFHQSWIVYGGYDFPTGEHMFQALKFDPMSEQFHLCLGAVTPNEAKKFGRKGRLRPDWESVKYDVMRLVVFNKFLQNPRLARLLVETGQQQLIEGNSWGDKIWGVSNGEGRNWLGIILMDTRSWLQTNDHITGPEFW